MSYTSEQTSYDELTALLIGRKEFYLALSGFYLKPLTQEQIDAMSSNGLAMFGAGEPLLEEGFDDIDRYLRKRNTGTRQLLATDFTSSFGGAQTFNGKSAMPYASVFLSAEGILNQKPRSDVFKVFKRNALRVTDTSTPEDHLSFMLEFLATMSERASVALAAGLVEDAATCLVESHDFINCHILTWLKDLADLANKLIETRFYRGVLKVTEGYLRLDLKTIEDMLDEFGQPQEQIHGIGGGK